MRSCLWGWLPPTGPTPPRYPASCGSRQNLQAHAHRIQEAHLRVCPDEKRGQRQSSRRADQRPCRSRARRVSTSRPDTEQECQERAYRRTDHRARPLRKALVRARPRRDHKHTGGRHCRDDGDRANMRQEAAENDPAPPQPSVRLELGPFPRLTLNEPLSFTAPALPLLDSGEKEAPTFQPPCT